MKSKKIILGILTIIMLFLSMPVEALENESQININEENITVDDSVKTEDKNKEVDSDIEIKDENITKSEKEKINNNIILEEPKENTLTEYRNNAITNEVLNGWSYEDGNTYYYVNGEKVHGFYDIEGIKYFFSNVNNVLKSGLQGIDGKLFYLNEKGQVQYGWYTIEGNTYYFGSDGYAYQGFKQIGDKTYFFSYVNSALKTGWQAIDGNLFYLTEEGTVVNGWYTIEGNTYYFENNYAVKGFKDIEGIKYFFSNVNNALKSGLQGIDGKLFYLNEKGQVQYGWYTIEGNTYYFGSDGYAYQGFKQIGDKTYFFSYVNSALKTGWQAIDGNSFYLTEDGSVFSGYGFQKIEEKMYYFEGNFVAKGYKEINDKTYYFDSKTGEFRTGFYVINCNEYYYNQYGILTKIQYIPIYYSQQDYRWAWTYYGNENMKSSGCGPTSMAMAFERILGRTILPIDVAYYLYNYTNEFNKEVAGTSGLALQYAANHFGVKWQGISSKNQLIEALNSGKIIYAVVGAGKFTVYPLTHSIVLYKYDNGNTIALDPYNSNKNGYVSVDTIWNEQTTNSYDLRGGYAFYALG